jgi:Fic family protein
MDIERKAKFIYNSNRLDNVHVPFETTLALCKEGPGPYVDGREVTGMDNRAYDADVVGSHLAALLFIEKLALRPGPFTENDFKELHRRLMDGVIVSRGEYRECTLRPSGIPPVPPEDIPRRVERIIALLNQAYERAPKKDIFAWQVHHEVYLAHPFVDGHGRTARLMLNYVRMKAGLELEVVPFAEFERYRLSVKDYAQKLNSRAASSGRLAAP